MVTANGSGRIASIHVGRPRSFPSEAGGGGLGGAWTTAIHKRAVDGSVAVDRDGLAGDQPADLERHGGPERALLAYPVGHYPWWRSELGEEGLAPGGFGENLAVEGVDEHTVCIGDRIRIGTAVIRVTQPRQPGWKLARRWQRIGLPKRMAAVRRTGWYLAVEEPGVVVAGDALTVLDRPCPEWSVVRALDVLYDRDRHRGEAPLLYDCRYLGTAWRAKLRVRHPHLRDV